MKYVLITPAHNEAAFIRKTLDSIVAQTLLPERWVIVDDGSTNRQLRLSTVMTNSISGSNSSGGRGAQTAALLGKYMPLTSVLIVLHH